MFASLLLISKTLFSTGLVLSSVKTAAAQLRDDIKFSWNSVQLPFPLSDHTATYMQDGDDDDENGFVLLTGGCNATMGNTRLQGLDGLDFFACLDTSTATLKFDPSANVFTEMAPMLRPRQRHAAAVVRGELYLVGGRDSNDELVPQIDSFDPKTNTWTERGELPAEIVRSDLAAWRWKDFLYVAGGFDGNYTAVGNVYRLNLGGGADNMNPMSFDDMQYEEMTASPYPRGDYTAAVLFGYAYMVGGITHQSYWCEAMSLTERYHMETDTWMTMAPLEVGRADMAVAVLNNKVVTVGGETKPDSCGQDGSDPAYGSFPANHVDVLLNPSQDDGGKWTRFETYPDERFRFAAAVVPALQRMYTFGGQLPFDFTCDCFPTSTDVGVGTEVYEAEESLSAGAIAAIVLGSLIGVGLVACICRKWMQRRQKEGIESQANGETASQQNTGSSRRFSIL